MKPRFTDEEKKVIQTAALQVWNYIGYDVLAPEGKETANTLPRSHVLELVCDAGRLEDQLHRNRAPKELIDRVSATRISNLYAVLRPAFQYTRYGL